MNNSKTADQTEEITIDVKFPQGFFRLGSVRGVEEVPTYNLAVVRVDFPQPLNGGISSFFRAGVC